MVAGDTVIVVPSGDYSNQCVTITKSGSKNNRITYEAQGHVTMKNFSLSADYTTIGGRLMHKIVHGKDNGPNYLHSLSSER
jgi:hypothetical protein